MSTAPDVRYTDQAVFQCRLCPARYSDPVDRDECEAEHLHDEPRAAQRPHLPGQWPGGWGRFLYSRLSALRVEDFDLGLILDGHRNAEGLDGRGQPE